MGVTLETVDGRLAMRSDGDAPGSGVAIWARSMCVRSAGTRSFAQWAGELAPSSTPRQDWAETRGSLPHRVDRSWRSSVTH